MNMFKRHTQDHYSCWKIIFENKTINCHIMLKEGSNCSWIHPHAMSQLCKTRLVDQRTKLALHFSDIYSYVYMHTTTNMQHIQSSDNTSPSILVTPLLAMHLNTSAPVH